MGPQKTVSPEGVKASLKASYSLAEEVYPLSGFWRFSSKPKGGTISVPRSTASICITVSGSGILNKAKAMNGTISGMLLANI